MKTTLIFTTLLLMTVACSKSGTKALEQGNYYGAVMQSVEKLRKDIDNEKASGVLPEAYRNASQELLRDVENAKKANQQFRWERALEHYNKLNDMHNAIDKCTACRRLVTPQSYFNEAEEARENASSERYEAGMALLKTNNRMAGREAFKHFETLLKFAPNNTNAQSRLNEALDMGSYHVVVEQPSINSRMFQYSNEFFQGKIDEFLATNKRINKFIRFYNPVEAKSVNLKPDHIVRLELVDFVVGQTFVNSDKTTVTSKDSVKVGETTVDGKKIAVYNKVTAQLTRFNKTVRSNGRLLMQIVDFQGNKTLMREEVGGEYVWGNRWASFNGDERALTKDDLTLCKEREQLPPPPQQLYIEFCKPIYDQVTSRIRRFYDKY